MPTPAHEAPGTGVGREGGRGHGTRRSPRPKLDLDYSARFWSGKELGQTVGSAFWLHPEKPEGLGLKGVGLRHLLERRPRRVRDDLMGVPHARGQMRQQAAEAMGGLPVRRLMGLL